MNLKEALDTAPYICIYDANPCVSYGPYNTETALEFCSLYNEWLDTNGHEGRWLAIPVLPSPVFPTEKDK